MKKLMIVLLFTVLGSSTVFSQWSNKYGPLYSDVMYCMMSGWIGLEGNNKESFFLMRGLYKFQRGYEGGWSDIQLRSGNTGISFLPYIEKSKLKNANQHYKNNVFGDIDGLIKERGKEAFFQFGEGFGIYESLNQRKIKGLTGFEEYSKQICDKLGISPKTFELSEKGRKKLLKPLLNTNKGVMKTCFLDDPKYLSIKGNKISGYVYDILNKYSESTGLKIKYKIEKKFDDCLKGMKSGKFDVITLAIKKPERTKYMDYYFPAGNKEDSIAISKKSPFAKFSKEIQTSVELGLANAVDKQQFLLDKWWGTGKGKCDLKDDYVMIFLWDNEGNEFWIVSNKFSEELTSKTKQLINSKWLIYGYGKPDIGENYISGEYYYLDINGKLEYYKTSYKFQNRKNKDELVMKTSERITTDESGKKIKQDVSEDEEYITYDCNINNIRGTKEFSSQLKNIKLKLKKAQSKK